MNSDEHTTRSRHGEGETQDAGAQPPLRDAMRTWATVGVAWRMLSA
jgi:hypothetical protein